MIVKRKRQVKVVHMEADRQASAMKAERQAAAVDLAFQISDWLQIAFRFISGWLQISNWFRLVQIDSSDFR